MRVAIINLTGGGISGGYEVYLRNVLPRLAAHPRVEQVLCASPATLGVSHLCPAGPKLRHIPCAPFRVYRRTWDSQLAQALAAFQPDVIFMPLERTLAIPRVPMVCMVQNMGPLAAHVADNPWSERFRYLLQRVVARRAIGSAARVIAPSVFVRSFLVSSWGIRPEKVMVIHYGSESPALGQAGARPAGVPDRWRKFLFTAGSIEPYRGLEDLLGAMEQFLVRFPDLGLVIAGAARTNMPRYVRKLDHWIATRALSERVCWAGLLSQAQMRWCYEHCRAFVMTSRVESFSMIALEALSHGCVSVVAHNPPLPEIFGEVADYYAPGEPRALARKLEKILTLPDPEIALRSRFARSRAAEFSWDRNVQLLVETLLAVANRSSPIV